MEEKINLAEELKSRLQTGVVTFTFRKKDGSERVAKGTTNVDFIPEEYRTKKDVEAQEGALKPKNPTIQTYYDLEKYGWRSFQKDGLLSIQSHLQTKE